VAAEAGFRDTRRLASVPSRFLGSIYSAVSFRGAVQPPGGRRAPAQTAFPRRSAMITGRSDTGRWSPRPGRRGVLGHPRRSPPLTCRGPKGHPLSVLSISTVRADPGLLCPSPSPTAPPASGPAGPAGQPRYLALS
jgi:hypothetical protein